MVNKSIDSLKIEVGHFRITPQDIVTVNILPEKHNASGIYLDFIESIRKSSTEQKPVAVMVTELESRGIKVGDKIKKLIESGFFVQDHYEALREMFSSIAIIKGRTTTCRSPEILIRDGFPDDCILVPAEISFHVAYLISYFITKEFLNIHNMDRLFIMSGPLEKLNKHDDDLIVIWDPTYNNYISTALYENPYSGDKNAGYLFFH